MRTTLTLAFCLFLGATYAQPYLIGSRIITFNDPARNRNVATQIRYPGETSGANAVVADGPFPVLVMGHGFAMGYDVYSNLWNYFVPKGYIMLLPTTEGGLLPAPSHGAFGEDLVFLAEQMLAENLDPASPFFGKVAPATALMGHSMGGGSSFLGAANNGNIQALVNYAAAETTPSAIAAAALVQVPTMVIAGANDCVTPIPANQAPMFAALTTCRAFINITGASHCQFAENSVTCGLGEITCSPGPAISRSAQHAIANQMAGLWLDHFLKGDPDGLLAVQDSVTNSTRLTGEVICLSTGVTERDQQDWSLAPVPTSDRLMVYGVAFGDLIRVVDILGRELSTSSVTASVHELNVSDLPAGTYRLLIERKGSLRSKAFVVAR